MLQEEVRAKVISEMGVVGWKAYSELTSENLVGVPRVFRMQEFLQNIVEVFSRTLGNCQDGRPSKKLERFLEAMPRLEDIKVCECLSECLFLKLALDMHDAYLMVFDRPLYKRWINDLAPIQSKFFTSLNPQTAQYLYVQGTKLLVKMKGDEKVTSIFQIASNNPKKLCEAIAERHRKMFSLCAGIEVDDFVR